MRHTINPELRAMRYRDYLRSDEWAHKRQEVFKRAGHRCQVCNSSYELTVHHRTYVDFGQEDVNDLICLCWSCHKLFHEHRRLTYVEVRR